MKNLVCQLFTLFFALSLVGQPLSGVQTLGEAHVRKTRNQALMVAAIQDGQPQYYSFGSVSRAARLTPDEHTIFEIGALSGVFTTTLMTKGVAEGLFGYGDPILAYLPQDVEAPIFQPQKCLEVVLPPGIEGMPRRVISCAPDPFEPESCMAFSAILRTHTSGLPNSGFDLYDWHPIGVVRSLTGPKPGFGHDEFFRQLAQYPLATAPGTNFRFSNLGIAAIGHLLSEIKGKPFEHILQEELLLPLGMNDTRFRLSGEQIARLAPGHDFRGKPAAAWDFDGMAPAAGLKSTAHDLAIFAANLENTDSQWADIMAQAQQSRVDVSFPGWQRLTQAGYGWLVSVLSPESNQSVVWMYGGTQGYRSFVGFIKDHHLGVVLLSNSATDIRELGFEMLEALYKEKTAVAPQAQ